MTESMLLGVIASEVMVRAKWLAMAALLGGAACGTAFTTEGGSAGGSAGGGGTGGSIDGGSGGVAGGGAGNQGGAHGGASGAAGGMGGHGGAEPCKSCEDAFLANVYVNDTQVCEGAERIHYAALKVCICNVVAGSGCPVCGPFCMGQAAPGMSCLTCIDDSDQCDTVAADCGLAPF